MRLGSVLLITGMLVGAALTAKFSQCAAAVLTTETATGGSTTKVASPAADAKRGDAKHADAAAKTAGRNTDHTIPQVEYINAQIRQGWAARQITPSPRATDGEWCRRLYLDLLGRTPSADEISQFVGNPAADKRTQLVNRLLGEDFVEEYARNWTTQWFNVLVGRGAGGEGNRMVNREGLQQALRRAFLRNVPYDKLVYDLISAKGVNKPGEERFNGYVNFLADKMAENGLQATARTSQIFLGLQVQCTQCHNHPFNEWKQNQFWEMNAFFRQTHAMRHQRDGQEIEVWELANQNFAGEDNRPDEAVLFYEQRNGITRAAFPVFVDGSKLTSDSGYVDRVDRRSEFARLVVTSDYLGKAMVNRLWAHFMGFGFTKPVDDMGPHNPPTHPELLDGLAAEFKKNSYDQKALIRWIVLSEPYALSSRFSGKNKQDDPSLGEKPAFSRFYLRQMRAEELYESLLTATEANKARSSYEEQEKAKGEWLGQFTIAFGTDENDETTTFNGTIPQVLMMMNGDLVQNAISVEAGGFLHRIAADGRMDPTRKINHLYLSALGRKPTNSELTAANELLVYRQGDTAAALQDVWWALLNSNEFILNH